MTFEQIMILLILLGMLIVFASNKVRFEIVALVALVISVVLGLVPADQAFTGFGHNAVISVAAILVMSQALEDAGFVEIIAKRVAAAGKTSKSQIALLMIAVSLFSSVMNNIGALALFMPIAIRLARKNGYSPSLALMPLAFGSLFGGMITLVGTPANIIVSGYRADVVGNGFGMFSFTPIGLAVTALGIVAMVLFGLKLIPVRKGKSSMEEMFRISDYTASVRITEGSKISGKRLIDLSPILLSSINVVGHIRKDQGFFEPNMYRMLYSGDRLVIEASTESLAEFLKETATSLADSKPVGTEDLTSAEISLIEASVMPNSSFIGQTARSLNMRQGYHVNLLALSRQGERLGSSPNRVSLQAGDVMLLQGNLAAISELLEDLGGVPLAERKIVLEKPTKTFLAVGIFVAALSVVAMGLLPSDVTFVAGAILMLLLGVMKPHSAYHAIDLSIIILLGALMPVSKALETTGAAGLIAEQLLKLQSILPEWSFIPLLMIFSIMLTNVINNAACALLMAPIAVGIAQASGHSIDPYLLAICIGSSAAYMTPIGHASCTVIMGPGGYRFGDYWKPGLVASLATVLAAVPVILIFFPL